MTLSKEQIDYLFHFTEKKLVRYYDLQVELVDHLASNIEEEMEANKNISFDEALEKVYARFGIFGFAHVVQEKQQALRRKNKQMWLTAMKAFFTLPKLIKTITVFAAAYFAGFYLSPTIRFVLLAAVFIFYTIYELTILSRARKNITKNILLLKYQYFISSPVLTYQYFILFNKNINSNLLFAITAVAAFVIQAALIEVSGKIRRQAMQLYPEAFIKPAIA